MRLIQKYDSRSVLADAPSKSSLKARKLASALMPFHLSDAFVANERLLMLNAPHYYREYNSIIKSGCQSKLTKKSRKMIEKIREMLYTYF